MSNVLKLLQVPSVDNSYSKPRWNALRADSELHYCVSQVPATQSVLLEDVYPASSQTETLQLLLGYSALVAFKLQPFSLQTGEESLHYLF